MMKQKQFVLSPENIFKYNTTSKHQMMPDFNWSHISGNEMMELERIKDLYKIFR